MIDRVISELGPWNWMVLGFVLLVMEIIAPGIFMLWIGIAAILIGAVSLLLWDAASGPGRFRSSPSWRCRWSRPMSARDWSAGATNRPISRCSTGAARRWSARRRRLPSRSPTAAAASSSTTRYWRVTGPDLPAGTQVRVDGCAPTRIWN